MRKILFFLLLGGLIAFVISKREEITESIQNWDFGEFKDAFQDFISGPVQAMSETLDELYKKWAEVTGLDWKLIKAIAITESSEDPNAIGDSGNSYGLMQIQNSIGDYYAGRTDQDLLEPDVNVQIGSFFLYDMILKYGYEGGIQAYNLGETKYRAGYRSPSYLNRVLNNLGSLA